MAQPDRTSRHVDVAGADKPLDLGNGIVSASIGLTGQVQALSTIDRHHGMIVLSGDDRFADAERYNPAAVRRHRTTLADPLGPGVGVTTTPPWQPKSARLLGRVVPSLDLVSGPVAATVTTWAPVDPAVSGIAQRWDLTIMDGATHRFVGELTGLGSLATASMTQLTEGGVLTTPDAVTTTHLDGGRMVVSAPGLPAVAIISAEQFSPEAVSTPLQLPRIKVLVDPNHPVRFILWFAIGDTREHAEGALAALSADSLVGTTQAAAQMADAGLQAIGMTRDDEGARLVDRAVTYAMGCCTVGVDDATAVLTDHRILPLTWTRDAYWTVTALAETQAAQGADLVRRHLTWLFDRAERPSGNWARSYLPTGRVKDPAFQLDQQCYPILEAVDHTHRCGDDTTLRRHAPGIHDAVTNLLGARHACGLLPTDETPADDPLDLPFHLSSNLLVAHTLQRVATVAEMVGLDEALLRRTSGSILRAIDEHLTIELADRRRWAYATDLTTQRWYHDANDIPTVLAPRWELDVPVAVWRTTLEDAFSRDNPEAFAPGPAGGLGSVHTPGAWPLGDAQEVMFAALDGDRERATNTLSRLNASASWDGALPEARDPETGEVRSRHWFAWPGCMLVLARQLLADPTAGHW